MEQEFLPGTRFRFFQAPAPPPAVPEEVVEIFQQSQQASAEVSAAVSRTSSAAFPVAEEEEVQKGSTAFEDDNMWKVAGYVDCKEVIVHVESEEHSVSIRDCAGYKAPTVVIVRGICRNLVIADCINIVVIMDGTKGSAIVHTGGFCPSPLTLREIDGLQEMTFSSNASTTATRWARRGSSDSDSEEEEGSPKKNKEDKKESGGGTVTLGFPSPRVLLRIRIR